MLCQQGKAQAPGVGHDLHLGALSLQVVKDEPALRALAHDAPCAAGRLSKAWSSDHDETGVCAMLSPRQMPSVVQGASVSSSILGSPSQRCQPWTTGLWHAGNSARDSAMRCASATACIEPRMSIARLWLLASVLSASLYTIQTAPVFVGREAGPACSRAEERRRPACGPTCQADSLVGELRSGLQAIKLGHKLGDAHAGVELVGVGLAPHAPEGRHRSHPAHKVGSGMRRVLPRHAAGQQQAAWL